MDRNRLIALVCSIGWWIHSWVWIRIDQLVRDGDEEGHVGAAELFRDIIREQGWLTWGWETWQGNYGEYPPLFAALVGAWWSLFTLPPSHLLIRGILPLSVFISACAIARIGWKLHKEWLLGFVFVLSLPLFNGVARHFMPEAMMAMFSCLSLCFFLEARDSANWRTGLLAGLSIGFGLLCKQSFILIAGPPLILLWWRSTTMIKMITCIIPIIIAGPWYLSQVSTQAQYLLNSSQGNAEIAPIAQILFYPLAVAIIGWGVIISVIVLWSGFQRKPQQQWVWLWIIGGLFILLLIPKKYPRLLLAWLPVGGLLLSAAAGTTAWRTKLTIILLLIINVGIYSHISAPPIPLHRNIEDRCAQEWIRPPSSIDLHYQRIAEQVKKSASGPIAVRGSPSIPCSIQSTHDWGYHLDPYLRRRQLDRDILFLEEEDSNWKNAAVQITWNTRVAIDDPQAIQINIQEK